MVSERLQREYNNYRKKILQLSETQTMGVKRKVLHEETPQTKKRRVEGSDNPSHLTASSGNGVITISSSSSSNGVITISSSRSNGVITISSSSSRSNGVITISSSSSSNADRNLVREESAQREINQSENSGPHSRATFEAKYQQENALGSGGFGQVFAGSRRADHLPVAIKHVQKEDVWYTKIDKNGPEIPQEVAIMQRLMASRAESQAASSPVALLDWYDLDDELILILERPVPCMDLDSYIDEYGGSLTEEHAQVIVKQLVVALLELERQNVFHRDIKLQNVLIETEGDVPRVRIIDFGLSVIAGRRRPFHSFSGTRCHIPPEFELYGVYTSGGSTVWELGALLYNTLHAYMRFNSRAFTTNQQQIREGLSEDCRSFLEKCLAISPLERSTLEQLLRHPWMK